MQKELQDRIIAKIHERAEDLDYQHRGPFINFAVEAIQTVFDELQVISVQSNKLGLSVDITVYDDFARITPIGFVHSIGPFDYTELPASLSLVDFNNGVSFRIPMPSYDFTLKLLNDTDVYHAKITRIEDGSFTFIIGDKHVR